MSILHKSIYIFCNFCKSCYPLNQRHLKVYKYLSYIKYVRSSILWSTVTKAASYGNYTAPAPPVVHYSAFPLIALSLLLPLLFSSFSLFSSSLLFPFIFSTVSSFPPPSSFLSPVLQIHLARRYLSASCLPRPPPSSVFSVLVSPGLDSPGGLRPTYDLPTYLLPSYQSFVDFFTHIINGRLSSWS